MIGELLIWWSCKCYAGSNERMTFKDLKTEQLAAPLDKGIQIWSRAGLWCPENELSRTTHMCVGTRISGLSDPNKHRRSGYSAQGATELHPSRTIRIELLKRISQISGVKISYIQWPGSFRPTSVWGYPGKRPFLSRRHTGLSGVEHHATFPLIASDSDRTHLKESSFLNIKLKESFLGRLSPRHKYKNAVKMFSGALGSEQKSRKHLRCRKRF